MPRQGRFSNVVGVATIVGTIFSGIAVALYAVDNNWLEHVPELRIASKSKTVAVDDAAVLPIPPPLPQLGSREGAVEPARAKTRKWRPVVRRVSAGKTARHRRRTVSIFAVAKDIPHPTRD